jgi:hypothetical protein
MQKGIEKRWAIAPNGHICLTSFDDLSPGSGGKKWAMLFYRAGWTFTRTAQRALGHVGLIDRITRMISKMKGGNK